MPEVSELATSPMQSSDFLLGAEPISADIQAGRAIEREHDQEVWATANSALAQDSVEHWPSQGLPDQAKARR